MPYESLAFRRLPDRTDWGSVTPGLVTTRWARACPPGRPLRAVACSFSSRPGSCVLSLLACLLLPSLLTSNAIAQRPTARDSAQRDSAQSLPAVTVAATRSPASILTTPLAVTRLSAPELRSLGGFGLDEALSRVPGVIAQSRYGTSDIRLMIRGFGARGAGDRSNSGTSRGVRVLLDGFPETEPDGRTALDQLDLATAKA